MKLNQDILRKMAYNLDWDGTCGTCGNSCKWHPKYGSMRNMKKTYCLALDNKYFTNNLIAKNSQPSWCPRMKELINKEKNGIL